MNAIEPHAAVTATVKYHDNGFPRQRSFTAPTEEDLLNQVFLFHVDNYPERLIAIKQVHYHGEILHWNDFLAHHTFAKGRMSFEEFKAACLNPEKITA